MNYRPRKRYRSDQHANRAEAAAARKRKQRLYEAAVRAGHPAALDAEQERLRAQDPMGPANALLAELQKAPREVRQARKAEYVRLQAECQAIDKAAARARYLKLRALAIAEYEFFA